MNMNNQGYIRVVEQVPELLQLDPAQAKDLQLIISLAYHIGVSDGQKNAVDIIDRTLTRGEIERHK